MKFQWHLIFVLIFAGQVCAENIFPLDQNQLEKKVLCTPNKEEQIIAINVAEKIPFTVRRTEFIGAEKISRRAFYRQFPINEGDIFSRKVLEKSLATLSRYRKIRPKIITLLQCGL